MASPCTLEVYICLGIASFPGPAQLTILKATESWAGPGNEAIGLGTCVHYDFQAVSKLGHSNFYGSDELDAITIRKYTDRFSGQLRTGNFFARARRYQNCHEIIHSCK